MMSDGKQIFISYSRQDGNAQAERLERELRAKGFRVWRDVRDIDPAKDFTADIERGIEESAQVVVCVTPDSKRDDSFVRREIQYALLSQKPVIPVRFAEIKPHLPIINYEWIDIFRDWDDRFARLCAILMGEAREFQQRQISHDPFRPYLETLYKRVVSFLGQAVIKLIDLTSEATPDAVNAPLRRKDMIDLFFEAQGIGEEKPSEPKPFHTFAEAFEYYEGRVLLLGEPGAGKTITLFATARDAAARRLNDPSAPLPLLGMISSWDAEEQTPLADWLASGYPELDGALIKQVIAEGRGLLLLDGLDELGGERKITRFASSPQTALGDRYDPRKRFIAQMPMNNALMITCRVKDYWKIGEMFSLKGAVKLRPLSAMQMQIYLAEQPELWTAIQGDKGIREMLQTPLLLSFFAFAYRDMNLEERNQLINLSQSSGTLRNKIFEHYVQSRFKHEEGKRGRHLAYNYAEVHRVLGQIALESILLYRYENAITKGEIQKILNSDPQSFIQQAKTLHFLVDYEKDELRFIHLRLRDYFAFRPLVDKLHTDPENRISTVEALARIGDGRAVDSLAGLLGDTATNIRLQVLESLGTIGDKRAIDSLLVVLSDSDWHVREKTAKALGLIKDFRALKSLIVALEDDYGEVRATAAWALGQIADEHAISSLITALSDSDAEVRDNAAWALGQIGTAAIESLTRALRNDHWFVRYRAAWALGKIGNKRATEDLIVAFHDEDIDVRRKAAWALGMIGDERAVLSLVDALKDTTWQVWYSALSALQDIGTTEALEALQKWREERRKQNE